MKSNKTLKASSKLGSKYRKQSKIRFSNWALIYTRVQLTFSALTRKERKWGDKKYRAFEYVENVANAAVNTERILCLFHQTKRSDIQCAIIVIASLSFQMEQNNVQSISAE